MSHANPHANTVTHARAPWARPSHRDSSAHPHAECLTEPVSLADSETHADAAAPREQHQDRHRAGAVLCRDALALTVTVTVAVTISLTDADDIAGIADIAESKFIVTSNFIPVSIAHSASA